MAERSTPCPRCGKHFTSRIPATGVVARTAKVFYLYPFICKVCNARFTAFKYGIRYTRRSSDRRQFERVEAEIPTAIHRYDTTVTGHTIDVSAGGCRLKVEAGLSVGDMVALDMRILADEAPLKIEAAIVRSVLDTGQCGLEFLDMDMMCRRNLDLFLGDRLSHSNSQASLTG